MKQYVCWAFKKYSNRRAPESEEEQQRYVLFRFYFVLCLSLVFLVTIPVCAMLLSAQPEGSLVTYDTWSFNFYHYCEGQLCLPYEHDDWHLMDPNQETLAIRSYRGFVAFTYVLLSFDCLTLVLLALHLKVESAFLAGVVQFTALVFTSVLLITIVEFPNKMQRYLEDELGRPLERGHTPLFYLLCFSGLIRFGNGILFCGFPYHEKSVSSMCSTQDPFRYLCRFGLESMIVFVDLCCLLVLLVVTSPYYLVLFVTRGLWHAAQFVLLCGRFLWNGCVQPCAQCLSSPLVFCMGETQTFQSIVEIENV